MKIELYRDSAGGWRWQVGEENRPPVLRSGRVETLRACLEEIAAARKEWPALHSASVVAVDRHT